MNEITLVDEDKQIRVHNMCSHDIGYTLVSSGVRRHLTPHLAMTVTARELRELSYQRGGVVLLQNYLCVEDKELAKEFGVDVDNTPEYYWTENDIIKALTTVDMDVLLDALDFAPLGIIEELKYKAIELEISDNRRIEAISKRTGADISNIIKNKHAYELIENNDDTNVSTPKRRRTQSDSTPKRRVAV